MQNGKSIIENDIEKYTAFLELHQRGLRHARPEVEDKWKETIKLHTDVLTALEALQAHFKQQIEG